MVKRPDCALTPIPAGVLDVDNRVMQRLAIRCTPCAPVATAEVEQWLDDEVAQLRASAPHAVLRLIRLTQTVSTGDIGIGWLLEIESTCGDEHLGREGLDSVLRDMRLLGLQPTVLRAPVTGDRAPFPSSEAQLNGAGL
jgi:hypothetical protein